MKKKVHQKAVHPKADHDLLFAMWVASIVLLILLVALLRAAQ